MQIQKKESVAIEFVECDYKLDEEFKPGLFLQAKNFLNNLSIFLVSNIENFVIIKEKEFMYNDILSEIYNSKINSNMTSRNTLYAMHNSKNEIYKNLNKGERQN